MPVKPTCGSQGEPSDDTLGSTLTILGILGGLASVYTAVTASSTTTILGVSAAAGIWAGAALAALVVVVYITRSYYENCHKDYKGIDPACTTGVINGITPSFNSISDYAYPFMAMHPRLDIVVKPAYWDLVAQNAEYIYCNNDEDSSPMILSFYHSDKVCAAGLGSTIGAVVGGAAGIIAGVIVGAIICAALSWLCILALLIAAAIAVTGVLAGAEIGGLVAVALAENDDPVDNEGNELRRGDYISTKGNLAIHGKFNNARVYWFATAENTTIYGSSTGTSPFSYTDPDTNIPVEMDICTVIIIE